MKLKKIFLLIIVLMMIVGCTNIENQNYDDIVNYLSKINRNANKYQRGYKYFLPKGLSVIDAGANHAILKDTKDNNYYLFFDLVSFSNNKKISYNTRNDIEYSKLINYKNKTGYVNLILKEKQKYLIEIMYNYAKIEVMVDKKDVKNVLINAISILGTIEYDNNVIKNMLEEDNLTYMEEEFDMFKKSKNNSNVLDYAEENVTDEVQEVIKDPNFIN